MKQDPNKPPFQGMLRELNDQTLAAVFRESNKQTLDYFQELDLDPAFKEI